MMYEDVCCMYVCMYIVCEPHCNRPKTPKSFMIYKRDKFSVTKSGGHMICSRGSHA
eukprot:COSAG01_NODE_63297_length_280_cov_1.386740_2_plen_55_part_01